MAVAPIVPALRERLSQGTRVSADAKDLDRHGRDMGPYAHPPDAVVFATSVEDVAATVRLAAETGTPVVPYGAGTSNSGLAVPIHGGISLDVSGMDRILEISPSDLTATVQAGVTRYALNDALAEHGLFLSVDPGADASVGGMCATNAGGASAVRYGSMRQNVKTLEVVAGDGRILRAGVRARKSSAGYDLVNLFVGSEGTLGVITEVTVKLQPIPEQTISARAVFDDLDRACEAVVGLIAEGVGVTRTELIDGPTVGLINRHQGTTLAERPTILMEIAGSHAVVAEEQVAAERVCAASGSTDWVVETDPDAQRELWRLRYEFAYALRATRPDGAIAGTDLCVPISELPATLRHARDEVARRGMDAALIAHAGDGNYHLSFMLDPDDPEDERRFGELYAALTDDAVRRGGTCTGEHGIGIRKIPFLERQHPDLIPWMQAIKGVFDPKGIMNPGKVLRG